MTSKLKIFVSSTQRDLQAERDLAEEVIKRLGHECLRAEKYISPGQSPEQVCKEMALSCDMYIGIYGKSYGENQEAIGISATEMEYKEAREENASKILVYVKQESEYEEEQARFLSEVEDFSNGYFRHSKFGELAELAQQMERDIIAWSTKKIHELKNKEKELLALKEKVKYYEKVIEIFGIPVVLK
jgi:hypothetical protein